MISQEKLETYVKWVYSTLKRLSKTEFFSPRRGDIMRYVGVLEALLIVSGKVTPSECVDFQNIEYEYFTIFLRKKKTIRKEHNFECVMRLTEREYPDLKK